MVCTGLNMQNPLESTVEMFADNRGTIQNVFKDFQGDILKIVSVDGAKRANHYHKTTAHLCYVTYGSIKYYERPVGKDCKPKAYRFIEGDFFWTGPMMEHIMVFDEPTEFLCFSTGKRTKEEYEADLVRLDFQLDEV
jgi:quercetin dioxygenase-like cupin family protein